MVLARYLVVLCLSTKVQSAFSDYLFLEHGVYSTTPRVFTTPSVRKVRLFRLVVVVHDGNLRMWGGGGGAAPNKMIQV